MKKYEAIGVVEVSYFTTALEIFDQMSKLSNVEYLASEKYLGGKLVTIIIGGSISNVQTAVDGAKKLFEERQESPIKMALVITNPHDEIMKFILKSN